MDKTLAGIMFAAEIYGDRVDVAAESCMSCPFHIYKASVISSAQNSGFPGRAGVELIERHADLISRLWIVGATPDQASEIVWEKQKELADSYKGMTPKELAVSLGKFHRMNY